MSLLTDSSADPTTSKVGEATTPKNLFYSLFLLTEQDFNSNRFCGGSINTGKFEQAFCAKETTACGTASHKEKKHQLFVPNAVYIVASSAKNSLSSPKIVNPHLYCFVITDAKEIEAVNAFIDVANATLENSTSFDEAALEHNKLTDRVITSMRTRILTESLKKEDTKSRGGEIKFDSQASKGYSTPQEEGEFTFKRVGDEISSYGIEDDYDTGDSGIFSMVRPKPTKVEMDIESLGSVESLAHISNQVFVNSGIELTKDFNEDPVKCTAKLAAMISSLEAEAKNLSWKLDELYGKVKKVHVTSQITCWYI